MRKKLYHGNCLEILDKLSPNKIDTCITDPPYELGFMGKDWDKAGVSFQKETWLCFICECLVSGVQCLEVELLHKNLE